MAKQKMIVVRGGGDIATGTIWRLHRCGWPVLILECEKPTAIRRQVAFCEAVYDETATVEGVTARRVTSLADCPEVWAQGEIPLLVDETAACLQQLPELEGYQLFALVDAILAKRNLGTDRKMAPVTIALGPGFCAGEDVDYVVETMRGHNLGRVIAQGYAMADTGIPGVIAGYGKERVIHAPCTGTIYLKAQIGDLVKKDEPIAFIGSEPVQASLTGILRGIIREGFAVNKGLKIADIDPRREQKKNCATISDKARCISGSVLEILCMKA